MNYVEIPHSALSADALLGVIKSHILREGTDYGLKEFGFEEKIESVKRQIYGRKAVIVYDQSEEVCHILRLEEWTELQKKPILPSEPTYTSDS